MRLHSDGTCTASPVGATPSTYEEQLECWPIAVEQFATTLDWVEYLSPVSTRTNVDETNRWNYKLIFETAKNSTVSPHNSAYVHTCV
jgi:hypothetical protein